MAIRHLPAGFKPLRNQCGLKFDIQQVCEETGTGTGDPYWDDVYLLLGFEEPAGSTTVTDEGPLGTAVTTLGMAVTQDAARFGAGSFFGDYENPEYQGGFLYFDGAPFVPAWGSPTNAMTLEFWVQPPGYYVFFVGESSESTDGIFFELSDQEVAGTWVLRVSRVTSGGSAERSETFYNEHEVAGVPYRSAVYSPPPDAFMHFMLVFSQGRIYAFLDGHRLFTGPSVPYMPYTGWSGNIDPAASLTYPQVCLMSDSGYIDELRVTAGVARATEPFEPPTAPFPRSA